MLDERFSGKRVAIFSANYFPHLGGVENYTYHISYEMARMGVHATVVTLACEDAKPGFERDEAGFEILRLPSSNFLKGRYPIAKPPLLPQRILADEEFDFIVINTRFYPQSLSGAAFAHKRGIKPVVIDHGSAHLTVGNNLLDFFVEVAEHAMALLMKRHPADYYGVSERSSEWISHFGMKSSGVLHNSIDAKAYAKSASERCIRTELELDAHHPLVAFVGRIIPEKGITQLVEAARMVPNAVFVAAGDGPLMEPLKKCAPDNFFFLGRLNQPDISALLREADLFCLPTRSEGFATSLLEAAACATPAIITDVGGAREVILDKSYGTIIPDPLPSTIANAIKSELSDPLTLEMKGQKVREHVERHFCWKNTAYAVLEACARAQNSRTAS